MTAITALLTNTAYGYPTRGARRRRKPTILACLHQTSNATATAMASPAHLSPGTHVPTEVPLGFAGRKEQDSHDSPTSGLVGVTAHLAASTWAVIRDRSETAASRPTQVMENLAAFQADPCVSSWYGFILRLFRVAC